MTNDGYSSQPCSRVHPDTSLSVIVFVEDTTYTLGQQRIYWFHSAGAAHVYNGSRTCSSRLTDQTQVTHVRATMVRARLAFSFQTLHSMVGIG